MEKLVGVRRFELPAPASRIRESDVNGLFLLINQEASTDDIALLSITLQDRLPQKPRNSARRCIVGLTSRAAVGRILP
jgi:hypothetical protein